MKPHYFIFESGKCVLGPYDSYKQAEREGKDYGVTVPEVKRFDTDSQEVAQKEFESLCACV